MRGENETVEKKSLFFRGALAKAFPCSTPLGIESKKWSGSVLLSLSPDSERKEHSVGESG
jgi:hypothetical protein